MYDADNETEFTWADCEAAIGKNATLVLTGKIVGVFESGAGPYVKFRIDERFGFGDYQLGIDLDALEVETA